MLRCYQKREGKVICTAKKILTIISSSLSYGSRTQMALSLEISKVSSFASDPVCFVKHLSVFLRRRITSCFLLSSMTSNDLYKWFKLWLVKSLTWNPNLSWNRAINKVQVKEENTVCVAQS